MTTALDWEFPATTEQVEVSSNDEMSVGFTVSSHRYREVMYALIGIIGIIGNTFTIVVISLTPEMRKKFTNWFLINQSVIDALASFLLIGDVVKLGKTEQFSGTIGDMRCKIVQSGFFMWSLFMASTYNLILITLERYLAVVYPITHKKHMNVTRIAVSLTVPWVVGLAFNAYGPILTKVMDGSCHFMNFNNQHEALAIGWLSFLLQYLLPLVMMIWCYSRMALQLSKSNLKASSSTEKAKNNIVKTLTLVCVCFVLCWTWNQMFFLLFNMGVSRSKLDIGGWFYSFTVTAANLNCISNPFIYAFKYRQFKKGALALFCKGRAGIGPEESSTATHTTHLATVTTHTKN